MGPRHFSRGITREGKWVDLHYELQWGHGISAVESKSTANMSHQIQLLQWGHGISAVESDL